MVNQNKNRNTGHDEKQRIPYGVAAVVVLVLLGGAVFGLQVDQQAQASERAMRDPVLGDPDAPITLIEYGAYGCQTCDAWHEAGIVDEILEQFDGQVKFIFRDMPIIDPPYSWRTAEIAQCALDEGNDTFWQVHDVIYSDARRGSSSNEEIYDLIEARDIDTTGIRACEQADTHIKTIQFDQERGLNLGIRGTPTWVINERIIPGANPDALVQAIRDEVARLPQ